MSLWTPDGEIPVDRTGRSAPSDRGPEPAPGEGEFTIDQVTVEGFAAAQGIDLASLSPEQRAQLEQMVRELAETQLAIAQTPAGQIVANHIVGCYELAMIKLSTNPPQVSEASLAIDVMVAALDAAGDRLGEDGQTLRQMLTAVQTIFVEISNRGSD